MRKNFSGSQTFEIPSAIPPLIAACWASTKVWYAISPSIRASTYSPAVTPARPAARAKIFSAIEKPICVPRQLSKPCLLEERLYDRLRHRLEKARGELERFRAARKVLASKRERLRELRCDVRPNHLSTRQISKDLLRLTAEQKIGEQPRCIGVGSVLHQAQTCSS